MTEAEKVSELHQEVKNGLMNDDVEKVKNWQKEAYHKQMIGGFKEAKEAEEGFKKAQKPWAKKLKEVREDVHCCVNSTTAQPFLLHLTEMLFLLGHADGGSQKNLPHGLQGGEVGCNQRGQWQD